MANKEVVLTYEGLKKLERELDELKGIKRREIAERIKQSLSFGDISENSEYDDAKNEQAQIENRISHIENMLKNVKLIDEDEVSTEKVSIGSIVKLFDVKYNEEVEYHIVGSTETNPSEKRISNESPVGAALIGKKKGSIIKVLVPDGMAEFKILKISK